MQGQLVATGRDIERYAYSVPEDSSPPSLRALLEDPELTPERLYRTVTTDVAEAAGSSDEALEVVRVMTERIRRAFPQEISGS